MELTEMIKATPITAEKSARTDEIRAITSCDAGKIVPLAYIPLLREDRVSRGRVAVKVDMMETAETLMNGVNVTVYAHFVPYLSFDRFNGLDQLNRSYAGIPETEGGDIVPFIVHKPYDASAAFYKTLGIHAPEDSFINSAPLEAYNVLCSWRRRARSTKLSQKTNYSTNLSPAFWKNGAMGQIVPDFDQAMLDGEVELNLTGRAPVSGIGMVAPTAGGYGYNGNLRTTEGNRNGSWSGGVGEGSVNPRVLEDPDRSGFPAIYAELENQGIKLSLSNIEMAKKTAAFAALRKQYHGLEDDHIVDLLMEAIRIPDAQMAQPILLDRQSTLIGYSKRFATDANNLDKSVTTGQTVLNLNMRTPAMNTGGVILITCEIVPEQLFERQGDPFLTANDVSDFPSFTRDYLDPEKVTVVKNSFVDVEHGDPDGTFGYAPLNHEWKRSKPRVGGKFMRQAGDPFVEDRQRIWAVERLDPTLTEDFYIVNNIHHNVFADTQSDHFEITTIGGCEIVGNTVFGRMLLEDSGDYDALSDMVDKDRVVQGPIDPLDDPM